MSSPVTEGDAASAAGSQTVAPVLARPGSRTFALAVDLFALGILTFLVSASITVVAMATGVVETPSEVRTSVVARVAEQMPAWVDWVTAGIVGLGAVVLSGALWRSRTSIGLRFAELEAVRPGVAGAAARWRLAVRWLVPLALFRVLDLQIGVTLALVLVLAGWVPCLLGGRRSLYDLMAGLVVIDPVKTDRAALAAHRQANPWSPPAD